MARFLRIFAVYALIAAAIFLLQWIPQIGIVLMLFLGMFWIGLLVHVFMIQITVMSFKGALPRLILILPGTFYAAGLVCGLFSEIPAMRWQSEQQWLQIDKQVPPETRDLTFADDLYTISIGLRGSAFQPEKLGFELFVPRSQSEPYRRVASPSAGNPCPAGARSVLDRCTMGPIDRPSSYVLIGGKLGTCGILKFWWATIYTDCQPIKLHVGGVGGDDDVVGRLTGAVIRKRSYFLFPTAGCVLLDAPPGWPCDWYVSPLWRDAYVGYHLSPNGSSRSAGSILMSALAQLRGRSLSP